MVVAMAFAGWDGSGRNRQTDGDLGMMNGLGRRPTCIRHSWQVLYLASAWLLAEEAR